MPDPTEVITAPPIEGIPADTGSPATVPPAQADGQPQEIGTPKVEGVVQPTQADGSDRRKPSDFYNARRRDQSRYDRLEQLVLSHQAEMKKMADLLNKSSSDPAEKIPDYLNNENIWVNPQQALLRLKAEIRKEILEEQDRTLPQRFSEFSQVKESERGMQEALDLMFPNSSGTVEPLQDRVNKDPERTERLEAIVKGFKNPLTAAKSALALYELEIKSSQSARPINPNAIKKGLVGAQVSGQPVGGGKKMMTLQELRAEAKKHDSLTESDNNLRLDEAWKKKRAELRDQISELVNKEKGNINQ